MTRTYNIELTPEQVITVVSTLRLAGMENKDPFQAAELDELAQQIKDQFEEDYDKYRDES